MKPVRFVLLVLLAAAIALAISLLPAGCRSLRRPGSPAATPGPSASKFSRPLSAAAAATIPTNSVAGEGGSAGPSSWIRETEFEGGSIVTDSSNDGTLPVYSRNMAGTAAGTAAAPPIVAVRYLQYVASVWTLQQVSPTPTPLGAPCNPKTRQTQYDLGWYGVGPGSIPTPDAGGHVGPGQIQRIIFGCGETGERMTVKVAPDTPYLLVPWPSPWIPDTPGPSPTSGPAPPTSTPTRPPIPPVVRITQGDPITVTVTGSGSNPQEWVALYNATDLDSAYSCCGRSWQYLNGTQTQPPAPLSSSVLSFAVPPPGVYNFRFFANQGVGTKLVQTADFEVFASSSPTSTPTPTAAATATPTPAALVAPGSVQAISYSFRIRVAGDFRIFVRALGPGVVSYSVDGGAQDVVNVAASPAARWIQVTPYLRGSGVFHFVAGAHTIAFEFPSDARVDAVVATTGPAYP